MAAAFTRALSRGAVEVRSAGTAPADEINPVVIDAMAEVGIDLGKEHPKILTPEAAHASDVVITMGCGDTCPFFPGVRYLDWELDDPAGKAIERVRPVRDKIRTLVAMLLIDLDITPTT